MLCGFFGPVEDVEVGCGRIYVILTRAEADRVRKEGLSISCEEFGANGDAAALIAGRKFIIASVIGSKIIMPLGSGSVDEEKAKGNIVSILTKQSFDDLISAGLRKKGVIGNLNGLMLCVMLSEQQLAELAQVAHKYLTEPMIDESESANMTALKRAMTSPN